MRSKALRRQHCVYTCPTVSRRPAGSRDKAICRKRQSRDQGRPHLRSPQGRSPRHRLLHIGLLSLATERAPTKTTEEIVSQHFEAQSRNPGKTGTAIQGKALDGCGARALPQGSSQGLPPGLPASAGCLGQEVFLPSPSNLPTECTP